MLRSWTVLHAICSRLLGRLGSDLVAPLLQDVRGLGCGTRLLRLGLHHLHRLVCSWDCIVTCRSVRHCCPHEAIGQTAGRVSTCRMGRTPKDASGSFSVFWMGSLFLYINVRSVLPLEGNITKGEVPECFRYKTQDIRPRRATPSLRITSAIASTGLRKRRDGRQGGVPEQEVREVEQVRGARCHVWRLADLHECWRSLYALWGLQPPANPAHVASSSSCLAPPCCSQVDSDSDEDESGGAGGVPRVPTQFDVEGDGALAAAEV